MIDTIVLHTPQKVDLNNPIRATQTMRTTSLFYHIKNLDIKSNEYGTTITGSLPKFLNGSNVETLHFQEIPSAIDNLSELLNIDVSNSEILRLDWTANIITEHPPKSYYSILGETHPYERIQFKNSLYFNCAKRKLLFYDKGKESRQPGYFLRYELRNSKSDLKSINLHLSDLKNPEVYNSQVQKWLSTYQKINKQRTIVLTDVKTPKDLDRVSFEILVNELGKDKMIELVKESSLRNSLSPYNKSRLLGKIKNVTKRNFRSSEFEIEMNEKFEAVAKKAMILS